MGGVVNRKTISPGEYQKKMDEIIKMGLPIDETFIAMVEEAGKYSLSQKVCEKRDKITQPALRKKCNCNNFGMKHKRNPYCAKGKWVDFSIIRQELYCEHGVGHGFHPHGCDGCCSDPSFAKQFRKWQRKMDIAGIKSQKHIFKEWDKKLSQKVDKTSDKKRDKNSSCIEDKEVDKIADKKSMNPKSKSMQRRKK